MLSFIYSLSKRRKFDSKLYLMEEHVLGVRHEEVVLEGVHHVRVLHEEVRCVRNVEVDHHVEGLYAGDHRAREGHHVGVHHEGVGHCSRHVEGDTVNHHEVVLHVDHHGEEDHHDAVACHSPDEEGDAASKYQLQISNQCTSILCKAKTML